MRQKHVPIVLSNQSESKTFGCPQKRGEGYSPVLGLPYLQRSEKDHQLHHRRHVERNNQVVRVYLELAVSAVARS